MNNYYISKLSVKKLWGFKDLQLRFNNDVNIIIGPNASGKTTLINILYDSLNGYFPRLCRTHFKEVTIELSAFSGKNKCKLKLVRDEKNLAVHINDKEHIIPMAPFLQYVDEFEYAERRQAYSRRRRTEPVEIWELQHKLSDLVSAVWLPVSRRLPISEEEELEQRRHHNKPLESVDERLSSLIKGLEKYHFSLNTELSGMRRDFQRQVLQAILYDKEHDAIDIFYKGSFTPPSEDDKQALLKAFKDVDLVGAGMEDRINNHFLAANDAASKLKRRDEGFDIDTLFSIPLINRTRTIVKFAQELEEKRENLFDLLHTFESIVNSFLNEKIINVSDQGELIITPEHLDAEPMNIRQLSSGEKQILILLTQALLSEKTPVVYVADEPELSLHVDWQEKLLDALTQLAGRCQFIFATHSPDIASGFGDKIIDLARSK